jgi:hypothetical protein
MNPLLAFKLWIAIGVLAMAAETVYRLVVHKRQIADEIEHYGWLTYSAAMFAAVLLGPITAAGAVAMAVHRRELRRQEEREWEQFEARRQLMDERAFELAVERCAKCTHERIVTVDYGMGPVTDKCVTCWAFRLPDGRWCANSTPPP